MKPVLVKPRRVVGSNVVFRNATKDDAEFIVGLRTDPEKGKYLSPTSTDISLQVVWMEKYANDNSQIYFIIEDMRGERFGTVRLYDAQGDSFCWGSWILREERPSEFALESALMVYRFALDLGFSESHFDVRKKNQRAWQFHERFGAIRVKETEEDYFYRVSSEAIAKAFETYGHYLPNGIEVTGD
jgi:RimJ/RimL family protein N-acetyltransferase